MSNPQAFGGISHISTSKDSNLKPMPPSIGRFFRQTSRQVAVESIAFYQRYISPHKGYHCAHRRFHGGLSCSEYVKQTIATVGLRRSLPLAQQRFEACRMAQKTIALSRSSSQSFSQSFSQPFSRSLVSSLALAVLENQTEDDRPAERVTAGEYYAPPEPDPLPPTDNRWSSCCVCGVANACCAAPGEARGSCGDPLEACSLCWDGCDVGGCFCCF